MKTVKLRDTVIGAGMPKICVPVTGRTREEILEQASVIAGLPADMLEWRADWYEGAFDSDKLAGMLGDIRAVIGDMPLLMTFRTAAEGGERSADADTYADICISAARTGAADLVDVEVFAADDAAGRIIECVHSAGAKVIASSHDFDKTPDKDEIISRLRRMQDLGADILKIAVMPHSSRDVLTLLSAAEEMASEHADRPLVAISMGKKGVISRLSGEVFGSAITFGAASRASAPGQTDVTELRTILESIHRSIR